MTREPVSKLQWGIAFAGASVATALALALFRLPKVSPVVRSNEGRLPIVLMPGKRSELAMRDLSPLFLPTRYNAEPSELRAPEPGRTFFDRDAERWRFSAVGPDLQLPTPVKHPANAVDALADAPGALALGIGRTELTPLGSVKSGGHLDVFAKDAKDSVLSVSLDADALPKARGRGLTGWRPLEFAAVLNETGLVGGLLLTRSSGVEEVDNHFRNYLAQAFRVGDRLPPGFYRIVVGP